MRSLRAFSLIELMVVVAVVALLAGVAVPAYIDNIVRSRVATALPLMEHYKNKSIEYHSIHGFYPTAEQLNMGTLEEVNSPQGSNPYTTSQLIDPYTPGGLCMAGEVIFGFSGESLGLSSDDDFFIGYVFGEKNGTIVTVCVFMPTVNSPTEYLPTNCTFDMTGNDTDDVVAFAGFDDC